MSPSSPVDDWNPRWVSFRAFLDDISVGEGVHTAFLTELDHDTGGNREWTRGQWRDQVKATGAALTDRGISPGDAIAMLAGNQPDALAVAFACWAYGWVYVPLNAHETDERLEFILRDADAKLVVSCPPTADRANRLAKAAGVPAVGATDLLAAGSEPPPMDLGLDEPALRVYTSGTTGQPKGVQLSIRNLLTNCDAMSHVTGWDATTRALVVLPIHHVNGLVVSSLQAWYVGSSIVLADRFHSDTFWEDVEAHRATVCSMVPTLLEFLMEQGARPAPASFREVYCGAGPLMTETVLSFEKAFGVPVRHLYGLSETTAVATMMPTMAEGERNGWYRDYGFPSIGTAVPHVEIDVLTADGDRCPAGQRGELVIRGATIMGGYAGRPDATAEALHGGWFHSGDEGFWEPTPDGTPFFFITGRIKELIIRGGVNISPFTIDEVLNAHPAVQFGLAIPFENRYYGEEIGAYVVPSAPVTEQEIIEFCAERIDFAYCPKIVIFGDEMPFTATGKAKRLSLKRELAAQFAHYRDIQFRRNSTPA